MPTVSLQPDSNRLIIAREVSHEEIDPARALTLREVRERYHFKGRGNRPINLHTLRRWANPKRGFRPAGLDGPTLLLPALLRGNELITMPEWVDWFVKESNRIRDRANQQRFAGIEKA